MFGAETLRRLQLHIYCDSDLLTHPTPSQQSSEGTLITMATPSSIRRQQHLHVRPVVLADLALLPFIPGCSSGETCGAPSESLRPPPATTRARSLADDQVPSVHDPGREHATNIPRVEDKIGAPDPG